MEKEAIAPRNGPETKGPYSPAIAYGDLVFVSGQGPVDPATGKIINGDVVEQFKLALGNIEIILAAAGSCLANVLKVTLYLAEMNDFQKINAVYKTFFGPVFPARTTIQAGRLPFDIKVEIDVIAHKGGAACK